MTFSAKPWLVIQREIRTPIAASFSSPTHTPVSPATRPAVTPKRRGRPDQHLLEIAHVAVDVAAVGLQIDDRIADELTGPVIRHVAAAAGFDDLDAARRRALRRGAGCASGRRAVSTPSVMTGGCSRSSS